MKNWFFLALLAFSIISVACNKDDDDDKTCTTCEFSFFGIETTEEACQDGDDVVVTGTALGISYDTTFQGSVEAYVEFLENQGYSCQ